MSMGDISPEDRERLVDVRFGELFDRHLNQKFADTFDHRLMEWAEIVGGQSSQSPQPPRASYNRPLPITNEPQQRQRRRSLLEISMSDLLGIG